MTLDRPLSVQTQIGTRRLPARLPRSPIMTPSPVTPCPVEQAIHVIGGKWKLLLLRSLLLNGPRRYNGLLATVAGISSKELTRNLAELTASGLIARDPPASEAPYALTDCGKGLTPTFQSLLTLIQEASSLWSNSRPPRCSCENFQHKQMKQASERLGTKPKRGSSAEERALVTIASAFVDLQQRRHFADYNLGVTMSHFSAHADVYGPKTQDYLFSLLFKDQF